ncbi:hypothetical protein B0H34DRAFT_677904 [Crassisporium funariophilum]|nr:hypothetical protein B0H34DRAFT_677904 [Crassisporium funariophilum]
MVRILHFIIVAALLASPSSSNPIPVGQDMETRLVLEARTPAIPPTIPKTCVGCPPKYVPPNTGGGPRPGPQPCRYSVSKSIARSDGVDIEAREPGFWRSVVKIVKKVVIPPIIPPIPCIPF